MATNYTTKTAALKATKADISKLDAKKMLLNGKNILDYISDSEFNSYDTRDPQLKNDELDIWNTEISLSGNGHIEVKPLEHDYDTTVSTQSIIRSAVKVIDNEVLGTDDAHLMYWQTDGLTNGGWLFNYCENLESFTSDLSSLTYGDSMFASCFQLKSFSSDLSNLTIGDSMFSNCTSLTSFSSDLPSLTSGNSMFNYCENLESFTSNLSSLENGEGMFYHCTNLTTFTSDSSGSPVNLSSLISGYYMFRECFNLDSFTSDLSSLEDGYEMFFYCDKLTSFNSDLSSLSNGYGMFSYCSNLKSFNSDLSSLTDGSGMFYECGNLTTFTSDLSSLTNGSGMFSDCKLDTASVANIIHFIPQRDAKPTGSTGNKDGNIFIGIGITNTDAAKQAFAEECYCNDWEELNKEFDDKNWGVQWQFNGEATTFDLRGERPSTAVYTKLEEVIMPTDENAPKPHYEYVSQDGDNFYNIHWYHDSNTDNEGYDYFESLEEAISAYGVLPKD